MDEENKKITKEALESVLDPREISELQMFLERPILMEAVKKVLLYPIMYRGVLKPGEKANENRNFMFQLVGSQMGQQGMINDEALGQHLRARWEGIMSVSRAFEEMAVLQKVVEKPKELVNKGR